MNNIRRKRLYIPAILLVAALFISADNDRENLNFVNPGFRINSEGDDFSPSITADSSIMVFSSKKPVEKSHNIFICRKVKGVWGDPFPIFELCTDSNEETPFISADGRTILFASDRPGGYSPPMTADGNKRITFDIYISHFGDGKWSEPELLKGDVNTNMNERTPSLSRDGKYLFFTRWPYKNPGKSRILMAELQNGRYVNSKELPESINSGNFEVAFIPSYRDSRYYFASMRNGGYGGWDVYYTYMKGNDFTQPVNAGPAINTSFDDLYFNETPSDYILCSNRFGGLGGYDIYVKAASARVQESVAGGKTSYSKETKLKINVADSLTGRALKDLPLRVHLISGADGEKSAKRSTDAKTDSKGVFVLYPKKDVSWLSIEPLSEDYCGTGLKVKVIPEQYQNITLYLNRSAKKKPAAEEKQKTPEKKESAEIRKDLPDSDKVESRTDREFTSVYFGFSSIKIRTEDVPEIYRVVEYMRQNSSANLLLTGYADPVGSRKVNNRISHARAAAVKKFITGMGINPERITVKGAGEIKKGRGKNEKSRRVDFTIKD